MIRKISYVMAMIILIAGLSGCSSNPKSENKKADLGVPADNELLAYFKAQYPDREPVQCAYEDITSDGSKDLIVIFENEKDKKQMCAVIAEENEKHQLTEPIPAPAENQKIQFKDIDEKDELEFIVSGSKNGSVGYAIYRIIDNRMINLFGEGMEDCCD
ncbi:putative lipoprotein [Peptoclostridium acidaminophilum DSM 3953]|uniref:Putative lipoprotein n=1 Tax=Peptoclostridium acidaminophilum DSM 3953 TaxID=1286171 RepID=W8THV3_PEPAC|nr:Cys-Cys-COOH (seleno)protein SaoC [Peptoclostridium acidaminophilum]AHM57423.1 putative lipoprotein [Peptoclostridium acidaminophilum DSM 3953]